MKLITNSPKNIKLLLSGKKTRHFSSVIDYKLDYFIFLKIWKTIEDLLVSILKR